MNKDQVVVINGGWAVLFKILLVLMPVGIAFEAYQMKQLIELQTSDAQIILSHTKDTSSLDKRLSLIEAVVGFDKKGAKEEG